MVRARGITCKKHKLNITSNIVKEHKHKKCNVLIRTSARQCGEIKCRCLHELANSRGALSYFTTYTRMKHLALEMVKGDLQNQNTKKHEHREGERS